MVTWTAPVALSAGPLAIVTAFGKIKGRLIQGVPDVGGRSHLFLPP